MLLPGARLHATISIAAIRRCKHALTHKRIANRLDEGRLVLPTARRTKVATHLPAYGSHGAGSPQETGRG